MKMNVPPHVRKVEVIDIRDNEMFYDIAVNGKYFGTITHKEGLGYSCGQKFHSTLHFATEALVNR